VNKVYVVTSGSYSDYHIVAVFSTREQAEEFAATYNRSYDSNQVEEFVLNEVARDAIRFVAYAHPTRLSEDADIEFHYEHMATSQEELDEPGGVADRRDAPSPNIVVHGYGRSPEAARKSALDNWYRWKAEKAGVA
jgi:hypothetical protein